MVGYAIHNESKRLNKTGKAYGVATILVGLDGSECSKRATDLAVRWAVATGARLVGVAVVDEPTICRPEPVGVGGSHWKQHRDAKRLADARSKAQAFLHCFDDRCAEAGVECRLVESVGNPADMILEAAAACDLIVLGRKTYFHFETQRGPDDTLGRVLRQCPKPILVVPETPVDGHEAVIAFDGSDQALHALEAYLDFASTCLPTSHVVSVDADPTRAMTRADSAAGLLSRNRLSAEAHPITSAGDPVKLILEQVADQKTGLLVMGISHRSRLHEFFRGSVTRTIIATAAVPLLLCN